MDSTLTFIDCLILVVYLVGIAALGIYLARRSQRLDEFLMPRRFGATMMVTHAFGTGTASDQAVTVASATTQHGISGIWYVWQWLPITPIYWLIAPILRRFRAVTTADIFRLRYDARVAVLFAVVGIASMSIKIGVLLKGSAALIESGTGGLISAEFAIPLITVLFVVYGAAGGLAAAIVTDFVQGILTLVFSFILLPYVLSAAGGIVGIKETLQSTSGGGSMLSLVAPGYIGPFFICMLSIQGLVGVIAQPHVLGTCAAGKTETEGRIGFLVGNLLKRVCTVAWCLTAIAAVVWYLKQGQSLEAIRSNQADNIYGNVAREFLPNIFPGLLGIFLAAILASIMSSCDSFMIAAAGLFTENIYRPIKRDQSEQHYIWTVRIVALVVVLGGLIFAYWLQDVVQGLTIWLKLPAMMGIPLWLGIFWRRATAAGAWACVIAGFAAWWLTAQSWFVDRLAQLSLSHSWRLIVSDQDQLQIYEPWKIVFYLTTALTAGIVVSLLTRRVDAKQLEEFFELLVTPVKRGEQVETPCTIPKGSIDPKTRRRSFWLGDFFVPVLSRSSWIGLVIGYACVTAIIVWFVWLFT